MRCRNPVIDHRRAQALKIAQTVLQHSLHTPASVEALCAEELEDLQDSEVELRYRLSPRRRQLRLQQPPYRRHQRTEAFL